MAAVCGKRSTTRKCCFLNRTPDFPRREENTGNSHYAVFGGLRLCSCFATERMDERRA